MTERHDRDSTVVVSDSGSGAGMGMVVGILLVLAILVAVWFFTLGPGRGTTNSGGTQSVPSAPAASQPAPSKS